jgi:hypothetical protein
MTRTDGTRAATVAVSSVLALLMPEVRQARVTGRERNEDRLEGSALRYARRQ